MRSQDDIANAAARRDINKVDVVDMTMNHTVATLLDPEPRKYFGPIKSRPFACNSE